MMTISLTVKHVAGIFNKSEFTIRRWVLDEREIIFDGYIYLPEKDPAGNWLFKRVKLIEHRVATCSNVK